MPQSLSDDSYRGRHFKTENMPKNALLADCHSTIMVDNSTAMLASLWGCTHVAICCTLNGLRHGKVQWIIQVGNLIKILLAWVCWQDHTWCHSNMAAHTHRTMSRITFHQFLLYVVFVLLIFPFGWFVLDGSLREHPVLLLLLLLPSLLKCAKLLNQLL